MRAVLLALYSAAEIRGRPSNGSNARENLHFNRTRFGLEKARVHSASLTIFPYRKIYSRFDIGSMYLNGVP